MPVALILALAASLGIHVVALFGPELDLSTEPDTSALMAELRPMPKRASVPLKEAVKPKKNAHQNLVPDMDEAPAVDVPPPVSPTTPESSVKTDELPAAENTESAEIEVPSAPSRLPEQGRIIYQVERGDRGFVVGRSTSEWHIADGNYQLRQMTETSGLVWLFKPYQMVMESRGKLTADGLQPERFSVLRNGVESSEKAAFDWSQMLIRVGNGAPQTMRHGTQDLLSFNYQLGFMSHPEVGNDLPLTTGKKYGVYRLEVLGDEEIEIPPGRMRTLHLRAPGVNTTELWLAYDYLLLPVKIRYVDNKGDSIVQIATEIRVGAGKDD